MQTRSKPHKPFAPPEQETSPANHKGAPSPQQEDSRLTDLKVTAYPTPPPACTKCHSSQTLVCFRMTLCWLLSFLLSLSVTSPIDIMEPGPPTGIVLQGPPGLLITQCHSSSKDEGIQRRVEQAGSKWLVSTPATEVILSYDRHDTATKLSIPNLTIFLTVPQGDTVHIDDVFLHHLGPETHDTKI